MRIFYASQILLYVLAVLAPMYLLSHEFHIGEVTANKGILTKTGLILGNSNMLNMPKLQTSAVHMPHLISVVDHDNPSSRPDPLNNQSEAQKEINNAIVDLQGTIKRLDNASSVLSYYSSNRTD